MIMKEIDYKIRNNELSLVSDRELLSIMLSEKASNELLEEINHDLYYLGKLDYHDLRRKGISHASSIKLLASLELGRRRKICNVPSRTKITSSTHSFEIFSFLADLPHEEFWCSFLNRSNIVLDKIRISKGGWSGTIVDIKIILREALVRKTHAIIVAHNHPSENTKPSEQDIGITNKLRDAAKIMDIVLLDSLIICGKDYYSFADNGLL